MNENSVLLIDLENFFLGRDENTRRVRGSESYTGQDDLETLVESAMELADGRRLVVKRAYANFNAYRTSYSTHVRDYYLRAQSTMLMELGVEPVQVFRFPGGGNKNAADMRLAMDAAALLSPPASVKQFILVTGDADFIPVVLELRRCGAEVIVIGVRGSTKPVLEKYCDRFEFFESLIAPPDSVSERTDEVRLPPPPDLGEAREGTLSPAVVRDALHQLLTMQHAGIKFAAVRPQLTRLLRRPFDPTQFGNFENTGDWLRQQAAALGIELRRGPNDWEVWPASGAEPAAGPSDPLFNSPAPEPERDIPQRVAVLQSLPSGPEQLADHYRFLLRRENPYIYMVQPRDWEIITQRIFDEAGSKDDARPHILHHDLHADLVEQCLEEGMEDAARKVQATLFQVFKGGCFASVHEPHLRDFHWSQPGVLAPDIETVEDFRMCIRRYVARILSERLARSNGTGSIDAEAFARLLWDSQAEAHQEEARVIVEGVPA